MLFHSRLHDDDDDDDDDDKETEKSKQCNLITIN
jgi:hypothetical protein